MILGVGLALASVALCLFMFFVQIAIWAGRLLLQLLMVLFWRR